MDNLDDDALLARVRSQPEAFGVFYRRYERPVFAYFMRRTGDAELAADLAAETFAAALLSARRYRPGESPALAWLFGIARHKLLRSLDKRRIEDRARRRLGWEPLTLDDDLLERVARAGADERVAALLDRLPPDQAQAVRARIVDEEAYAEIAGRLRCSQSVVRQRVSRGLGTLRALIEEDL
jgi:RNA polymerase sigma factor (sigma-70 family)